MTRRVLWFEIVLVFVVFSVTMLLYPHLSNTVPTHWNSRLEPNGYSPKWTLVCFGPGLIAAIALFTWIGPWLSPKKFEMDGFLPTFNLLMSLVSGTVAYCFGMTLWAATGHATTAVRALEGGVCLLLVLVGNWLGKVRRNFFIGIRTPWTLASERVWHATHRLAAKTFVAGGLLALALVALNFRALPFWTLLIAALTPAVYSLVLYKQLERRGETL